MLKFYICRTCGNIVEMIEDSGIIPNCCGDDMEELIPGITDGAKEKHVPVWSEGSKTECQDSDNISSKCVSIKVGELPHPMTPSHLIQWIAIETSKGVYRKVLQDCTHAQAEFLLKADEDVKAIYAYCNLHGLWMSTLK